MSRAGTLSPVSLFRNRNSREDHGFAISLTLATPDPASVTFGTTALGLAAGGGTSICAAGAAIGRSSVFGRKIQRTANKQTTSAVRNPISRNGLNSNCSGRAAGCEMPGTCGISVLKRSGDGWLDIQQSFNPGKRQIAVRPDRSRRSGYFKCLLAVIVERATRNEQPRRQEFRQD